MKKYEIGARMALQKFGANPDHCTMTFERDPDCPSIVYCRVRTAESAADGYDGLITLILLERSNAISAAFVTDSSPADVQTCDVPTMWLDLPAEVTDAAAEKPQPKLIVTLSAPNSKKAARYAVSTLPGVFRFRKTKIRKISGDRSTYRLTDRSGTENLGTAHVTEIGTRRYNVRIEPTAAAGNAG